jgi:hypothetical protein
LIPKAIEWEKAAEQSEESFLSRLVSSPPSRERTIELKKGSSQQGISNLHLWSLSAKMMRDATTEQLGKNRSECAKGMMEESEIVIDISEDVAAGMKEDLDEIGLIELAAKIFVIRRINR